MTPCPALDFAGRERHRLSPHTPFVSSEVETRHPGRLPLPFWCYILRCVDGSYYTGHSDDLERRIAQHTSGETGGYTATRRPVHLIWAEEFPTRDEALESELRAKKWSRAKKEALARSDWAALSHFARPPRERVSTSLDTNGGASEPC